MSNTIITLIDPNEPCKHGYSVGKCPVEGPVWCPGGRERTYRKLHPVWARQATKDEDNVYVEVTDESH